MPNEFVARNGIIALNNSVITGSLTVTNGITGSFQGTASFSTTASNVLGGATNYIPLWNGATSLSSSVLYQSSGNVGIGTTSPYIYSTWTFATLNGNGGSGIVFRNNNVDTTQLYGFSGGTDLLSTGYFQLYTSGSARMYIGTTGNVGIGTTSPQQKLVVSNAGAEGLEIIPAPSANANQIQSYNRSTSAFNSLVLRASEYNVQIGTTAALYISASGNVGIGTTTPLSKLHISSPSNDVGVRMTNTTAAKSFLSYVDVSGNYIIYDANVDNNRLTITSAGTASFSGNVGIGTTSPASTLDVRGVVEAGTGTIRTVLSYTGTGGVVGTLSNHPLIFYANNDERARITAAGNFGIGTTTPGYKLDVNGQSAGIAASFGAQISNTNFSGISFGYVEAANTLYRKSALVFERSETHGGGSNASGKIHFLLNNNGASSATALTDAVVTIDSVGTTVGSARMGIGTRFPTASLHISGSVSTDNLMRVQSTAGAEYFFISASGNVGIGTSTPSGKLDIQRTGTGSEKTIVISRNSSNVSDEQTLTWTATDLSTDYAAIGGVVTGVTGGALTFKTISSGTSPSERMRINSAGNVGIGTTSPTARLQVEASTAAVSTPAASMTFSNSLDGGHRVLFKSSTGDLVAIDGDVTSTGAGTNDGVLKFWTSVDGTLSERMRIASAGNVGIGTTSPSAALHIARTAAAGASIRLQTTDSTANGSLQWANSANSIIAAIGSNYNVSDSAGGLELIAGGTTTKMFISSSGNVGIGTSTPTARLDVLTTSTNGIDLRNAPTTLGDQTSKSSPRLRLVSSRYEGGNVDAPFSLQNVRTGSPTNDQRLAITNFGDTEVLSILNTGNVGIGTTSPAALLHLSSTNPTLRITNTSAGAGAGSIQYYSGSTQIWNLGTHTDNDFYLYNNITAAYNLWIDNATGNVGIGTTSPSQKLVVSDNINGSVSAWVQNENTSGYSVLRAGSSIQQTAAVLRNGSAQTSYAGASSLNIYTLSTDPIGLVTNNILRMIVTSDGNVGIGTTSPSTKLHVNGQTYITDDLLIRGTYNPYVSSNRGIIQLNGTGGNLIGFASSTTTHGYMFVTSTNYEFVTVANQNFLFYNGSTEALRITNASNIGIGTTSPAAKLQVNGNTLITGSLTVGQSTTGSNENTLTVGLPLGGGTGEGGQILLAASGGLYTSASMLDNYQNTFRILRGTNAGSDASLLNLNLHTGQLAFARYTSSTAFTGTAAANLAVDSSGNVITVATGGGGGSSFPFTGDAVVTGSFTVVTGSATELRVTNTGVDMGSALTDAHRISGSISMPHTASGLIRLQDASVWANSANYTHPQIRLPDYRTGITLLNNDEIQFVTNATAPMGLKLSAGIPKITLDSSAWLQWSSAATNGFTHDVILKRESAGVLALTGSLKVSGDIVGAEPIPAGAKLYLFYNY